MICNVAPKWSPISSQHEQILLQQMCHVVAQSPGMKLGQLHCAEVSTHLMQASPVTPTELASFPADCCISLKLGQNEIKGRSCTF